MSTELKLKRVIEKLKKFSYSNTEIEFLIKKDFKNACATYKSVSDIVDYMMCTYVVEY